MAVNGYAAAQDVANLKTSTSALAVAMGLRVHGNELKLAELREITDALPATLEAMTNSIPPIAIAEATTAAAAVVNGRALRDGSNLTGSEPLNFRKALGVNHGIYSALQYLAAADGVADDTAELQALFTAGAGGVVTLPQRNAIYKTSFTLFVPANTIIDGQGSEIRSTMTNALDAIRFTDGGGARDLTVRGPYYVAGGVYGSDNNGIVCRGTRNIGLAPTLVKAPTFDNVTVSGYGFCGIRLEYCNGSVSNNLTITNCGYAGICTLSCNDVRVNAPTIRNIAPGVSLDAYGIFFDRYEAGTLISDPPSYRCSAYDVNISGVRGGGNGQGVDSHGGIEIVFEGVINDCDVMGAFTASNVPDAGDSNTLKQTIGPKRCRAKLTGTSNHAGYGFFIVGAIRGSTIFDYADDCELDINMTGYGKDIGDGSVGGTFHYGTKNLKIRGHMKNTRSCCIYLLQDNYGLDIDVVTTDPHSATFTVPGAIRVTGNNNTGRIAGSYRCVNTALAAYVAVTCVRIEAGLTGLDLDFLPSSFSGIASGRLAFQLGTTTGVRFHGMQNHGDTTNMSVADTGVEGILDVTFPKRFPYIPRVRATAGYPGNGGGKRAVVEVRDDLITETGFRVYAYPAAGGAWTATGTIPIQWDAV